MQIQGTNNSTNFGIKYIKPRNWRPEVLDALMHSNLTKEIDSKYPHAKVRYIKPSRRMKDETLFMCGQSQEGYLKFTLNGRIKQIVDSGTWKMVDYIKDMRLNNLEPEALQKKQEIENIYRAAEASNRSGRLDFVEHIKSLFW